MMWEKALRDTALEYSGVDPEWGASDCCQFARLYYQKVTGNDIGAFAYESEGEAKRILAKYGGMAGLLSHLLGESREPEPGDVVLVDISDEGELSAAGVFNGYCAFVVHPGQGLCRLPRERILKAWPVV